MEDEFQVAYVQRSNTPARDAFDACNCDERPAIFYNLTRQQMSSPTCTVTLLSLGLLKFHSTLHLLQLQP